MAAAGNAVGDVRARLGVLFRLETDGRSGAARVLVQSHVAPDWGRLPAGYVLDTGGSVANPDQKFVGEAFAAIRAGDELVFRLRANPTKRLRPETGPDGVRRDGKRVELRTEEELLVWFKEKGDGNPATGRPGAGFRLLTVQARPGLAVGVRGGSDGGGRGENEDRRFGGDGAGTAPEAVSDARARSVGKVTGSALRSNGDGRGAATRRMLTFGDVVFDGRLLVTDAELFGQTLVRGIGSGKAFGFGLLSVARSRG